MEDLLGYQRQGQPLRDLGSSEFAVITLAGQILTLAQGLNGSYQQEVRPAFVLGESSVFWLNGFQQGQVELTRLAGGTNFFEAFQAGNCGIISAITVSVNGSKPCPNSGSMNGKLRFSDGIIQNLSIRMQAGQSEIVETAIIRVATISN